MESCFVIFKEESISYMVSIHTHIYLCVCVYVQGRERKKERKGEEGCKREKGREEGRDRCTSNLQYLISKP